MNRPLVAALCATLALGACSTVGKSRLNPMNWFGGSEETQVVTVEGKPVDPRPLITQITDLKLERMPGGVIIRATGLPPSQGFWDAELVARPVEDGQITYDFHVFPPVPPKAASTPQSREVTVASYLSNTKLEGIRQITVQGATNARSSRR
ncbi:hypothetical protein EOK75_04265 [Pseudorhodobacter turbinis]|uniref:Lipoprotein n=1 Tax=Pseudorhodobacter turbinis TaxID=2500533 RepID=A0A4P8EEJ2_9RHOB|nr:hypothetical protein [Pseudorhodobacter turbinis]QCO55063.1 hypothetical protein EOK75_04265 [Pseudorhodobacter turbinis]